VLAEARRIRDVLSAVKVRGAAPDWLAPPAPACTCLRRLCVLCMVHQPASAAAQHGASKVRYMPSGALYLPYDVTMPYVLPAPAGAALP
jgi:hypothetical protein